MSTINVMTPLIMTIPSVEPTTDLSSSGSGVAVT